jgi:predicted MFS family arabinose efflux permease
MRNALATSIVFAGGFVIMVLEIVGARYLAKDFGSSFYVWTSQIGIILIALAAGYYAGGTLADHQDRLSFLAWLLFPAGTVMVLIPWFGDRLINAIIVRHPVQEEIPPLWQKLDPALGSALIFLLPCFALATLSPYMIRIGTRSLAQVGKTSGFVIGASTLGSIAGVFVSGYVLIDSMRLSVIFYAVGILTIAMGLICLLTSNWFNRHPLPSGPPRAKLQP